uniref:DUF4216 domain-containing protein n=1 Tax=Oryza brachyantha TaxID=4533 RepID=J3N1C9_ORYBR
MEKLEYDIAETLRLREKIFPPSFVDVMVYLCVHLPTEARLVGPVQYRNMYPVERKHLSILSMDKRLRKREVKRIHHETFHAWLLEHVNQLIIDGNDVSEELRILANRPYRMVKKYNSYALNGYKFQTKSYSEGKSTQNYGLAVIAQTASFSSASDQNPVLGDVTYYGVINDIIELNYSNKGSVLLFKCDWVDTVRGYRIQIDKFGITLVNFNHLLNSGKNISDEPNILARQATQVYYVQDLVDSEWHAVRSLKRRDIFDMQARDDMDYDDEVDIDYFNDTIQPFTNHPLVTDVCDNEICAGTDISGVLIDESLQKSKRIKDGRKGKKRKSAQQSQLNSGDEIEVQDDPDYIGENHEEVDDYDYLDDFVDDNNIVPFETDLVPVARKVRGPTKMTSNRKNHEGVKIFVKINGYGQPRGLRTCNFTNFIAALVKGGDITLKEKDWRLVKNKEMIWTTVNIYFDIDPICEAWVLKSAASPHHRSSRVLDRSEGCRLPSSPAPATGAVLGRPASRAEVYVVTHTKVDGQAVDEKYEEKIGEIRNKLTENPDLALKSIHDGDLYDEIFPSMKKRKQIAGIGLTAGAKTVSVAMATDAVRKMGEENAEVRARMEEISSEYKSYKAYAEERFTRNEQQFSELKEMLLMSQLFVPIIYSYLCQFY